MPDNLSLRRRSGRRSWGHDCPVTINCADIEVSPSNGKPQRRNSLNSPMINTPSLEGRLKESVDVAESNALLGKVDDVGILFNQ